MKKIIVSALFIAIAALSVKAQEIPDRKREEFKPVDKGRVMDKKEMARLNLTDEQREKLKAMTKDLRSQMADLRKQDNLTVKEYREKMESLRKEQKAKFESVLTPEQKAEMQKNKEALKEKAKEYGRKKQAKMKEELNLSDEQAATIAEKRKQSMEKIKTIKEDESLSDEQKKEQVKEIMKAQKKDMQSILTEEQLQKMKELKKKHPDKKQNV